MYILKYDLVFLSVDDEAYVGQQSDRREFAHIEEPLGGGTAIRK